MLSLKNSSDSVFRKLFTQLACGCTLLCILVCFVGCGATKSFTATEQLLMSDAVDSTIMKMDFRPLSGQKVFLDTTYVSAAGKVIPGVAMPANLVTSDYIISALRQQLTAAGCMLVDTREAADLVCEARCGALGTDGHSVTYGLPANNFLSTASAVIPGTPVLPTIPEISVAKREMKSAAAKVAVFAYDRETREPVWQSGIAQAGSSARDTWVLGVGPLQQGSIYGGSRFAGKKFRPSSTSTDHASTNQLANGIDYRRRFLFANRILSKEKNESGAAAHLADRDSDSVKR
ncbi:MAG: hypothetical protein MUC83_15085 [Pirellula sp.]|nr:hypothetical protein [Pirellula sp.]